eukprot:365725-Chlamydomonas_euryale.AAC.21
MGTRAGCAAALRLAFGALTHGAGGGSGIQRGGFGGVPAVTGLMRSRGLSSGAPDDPKQPAGGAGSAASPASHGAASTSGQGESATDAQVPGWLKGPKLRQTSTLREEWVEAAHPASGEKCWKSAMTGAGQVPGHLPRACLPRAAHAAHTCTPAMLAETQNGVVPAGSACTLSL